MTDEQVVEVIRQEMRRLDSDLYDHDLDVWMVSEDILAALRGAGFDVYRPDDCERYWMVPGNNRIERHRGHLWADQGPERDGELSPAMRAGRWVRVVENGGDS